MPNNRDRIITYEQGDRIISALSDIKNSLSNNNAAMIMRYKKVNSGVAGMFIPAQGEYFSYMFNSPVLISTKYDNGTDIPNPSCVQMFEECYYFNQPVNIPSGVTNCDYMFSRCSNFNSVVNFPDTLKSCEYAFAECYNYNQPVTLCGQVENCGSMFDGDYGFNAPVTIMNGVVNCASMLYGCSEFNQPVTIPESVNNCAYMFDGCFNMTSDIYIDNVTDINAVGMLPYYDGTQDAIHVYCNNLSLINGNNYDNSIISSADVNWTPVTNGYYSADFNVYILNNYPAA